MSKQKQCSDAADSGQSEQAEDGVRLDPETQQTDDAMEPCACCAEMMGMLMDKRRARRAAQ